MAQKKATNLARLKFLNQQVLHSINKKKIAEFVEIQQFSSFCFESSWCLTETSREPFLFRTVFIEIEVSKQNEWTTETIKGRGLSMLQFMEERWKFKFKDWEIEKEEILFPSK